MIGTSRMRRIRSIDHDNRVAEVEASLPAGLKLAGASYHGIGVPACIRSAQNAAAAIHARARSVAE